MKESDRLATIAQLLATLGVPVRARDDGLEIDGVDQFSRPARWPFFDDHRLALCCTVAAISEGWPLPPQEALAAGEVSYPGFAAALEGLRS